MKRKDFRILKTETFDGYNTSSFYRIQQKRFIFIFPYWCNHLDVSLPQSCYRDIAHAEEDIEWMIKTNLHNSTKYRKTSVVG